MAQQLKRKITTLEHNLNESFCVMMMIELPPLPPKKHISNKPPKGWSLTSQS